MGLALAPFTSSGVGLALAPITSSGPGLGWRARPPRHRDAGQCWLVDPEARSLEILQLGDGGRYVHELDTAGGVVVVPGCEGLTLDLDALWREIEELVEDEGPEGG